VILLFHSQVKGDVMKVSAIWKAALWSTMLVIPMLWGCNKAEDPKQGAAPSTAKEGEKGKEPDKAVKDDHSGWWCPEHGVPEKICAQCDASLVADFKKKGDWCAKHNRPESQCFICHPDLEAKFAAQYEAKYGKKPPKREAEEKDEHKEKSS